MSNTLQNLIDMSFESEDATDSLSDADPQFIQKLSLYLSKNESLPNDAEQQASLSHHNEQEPPPQGTIISSPGKKPTNFITNPN